MDILSKLIIASLVTSWIVIVIGFSLIVLSRKKTVKCQQKIDSLEEKLSILIDMKRKEINSVKITNGHTRRQTDVIMQDIIDIADDVVNY